MLWMEDCLPPFPLITTKSRNTVSAGCNYAGLIVVLPTTDGDRIVIVDYYISGVVPKSLSSLDAKRALYPVNDIKVFYKYIAKNVTNFWRCP